MSKYANFNNLVANHLDTARQSVTMDISYIFGKLDERRVDDDIAMGDVDNAYDFKGVMIYIGKREESYVMYAVRDDGVTVPLCTIANIFELYQITDLFSEVYLNLYMNGNQDEVNDARA